MAEVAVQFSSCYRHQSVRASKGGEITMQGLTAEVDELTQNILLQECVKCRFTTESET